MVNTDETDGPETETAAALRTSYVSVCLTARQTDRDRRSHSSAASPSIPSSAPPGVSPSGLFLSNPSRAIVALPTAAAAAALLVSICSSLSLSLPNVDIVLSVLKRSSAHNHEDEVAARAANGGGGETACNFLLRDNFQG